MGAVAYPWALGSAAVVAMLGAWPRDQYCWSHDACTIGSDNTYVLAWAWAW